MESNGLPVSIICSPANEHDSTKFIDAMENMSELAYDELIQQIATVYADKGYDAAYIGHLTHLKTDHLVKFL